MFKLVDRKLRRACRSQYPRFCIQGKCRKLSIHKTSAQVAQNLGHVMDGLVSDSPLSQGLHLGVYSRLVECLDVPRVVVFREKKQLFGVTSGIGTRIPVPRGWSICYPVVRRMV